MIRVATWLLSGVGILLCSGALGAQACPALRSKNSADRDQEFPALALEYHCPDAEMVITLVPDNAFRSNSRVGPDLLHRGVAEWNECPRSLAPSIPGFRIDYNGTRAPNPAVASCDYKSRIAITMSKDPPVPNEAGLFEAAYWDPITNTIVLSEKCPADTTAGFPCQGGRPGGYIEWNRYPIWAGGVIGHELGHMLGLKDEKASAECPTSAGSLMWGSAPFTQTNFVLYGSHCAMVDRVNDENHPCTNVTPEVGQPHPCDAEEDEEEDDEEGGPGNRPRGPRRFFCDTYPWICEIVDGPLDPGHFLDCSYACVSFSDNTGASASACNWNCLVTSMSTGLAAGPPTRPGVGPRIHLRTPATDQVVAGALPISGWAVDYRQVSAIHFDLDGERVHLADFRRDLDSPGACTPPMGLHHRECNRRSGFQGVLDTTGLSNGPHKLSVIAHDDLNFMTTLERTFIVDNNSCGDTPPHAEILSPVYGRTVGGQVRVLANILDPGGAVQGAELWVDGARISSLNTAPYAFVWNAENAAPGEHRLSIRATDRCGNVGASSEVRVVVDNRQYPFPGLPAWIPGRVEAENYDIGAQGVAWDDQTPGNIGGQYRNDDVDLSSSGTSPVVAWVDGGEWLEYSIQVQNVGPYSLSARTSSPSGGGRLRVEVDGVVQGTLSVPATGGWNTWASTSFALELPAGVHVLRLVATAPGFNLDRLDLQPVQTTPSPPAIVTHPLSTTVGLGDTARFQVEAAGQGPLAYWWLRNGVPLAESSRYSGVATPTLQVSNVDPTVVGEYRCEVTNSGGRTTSAAAPLILAPGTCSASSQNLCLVSNRFKISARVDGQAATVLPFSDQAGFFRLWNPGIPEVAVKLIDARPGYGHFWLFHGSMTSYPYEVTVEDTITGRREIHRKTAADLCGGVDFDTLTPGASVVRAACTSTSTALCLADRFLVRVLQSGMPQSGSRLTPYSGAYVFQSAAQPEVVVNILDATQIDGHYWVFFGSMTSQHYQVQITDTESGATRTYPDPAPLCGGILFRDF